MEKPMDKKYVKSETLFMVAFICLAVGFLGGVAFGVYKSTSLGPVPKVPQRQVPAKEKTDAELDDKLASLERETSLHPENEENWIRLGNLYFDTDQSEEAIKAYKKALELNPDNANVWTDLGVMYRRTNQPHDAIAAFDKASAVDPRHETSRFNKGIVLMHDLNDIPGAVRAWEGLVKINPSAMSPNGQPIGDLIKRLKASLDSERASQPQK